MPIFQHTTKEENAIQGNTGLTDIFPWRLSICEALRGVLSGFYLCRMIYHPAIKAPFIGVLRALQEYGGGMPAMEAGNVAAEVSMG